MLTPPLEAGTKLWGFQRGRHLLCDSSIGGGVKSPPAKWPRLFMLLAENCKHAWVGKVDLAKVDFGKGKRTVVKGGRFDPKYKITVPNTETAGTAPGARP